MFLPPCTRLLLQRRTLTTLPLRPIYISRSKDPLVNLSYEDWLFRHAPPDNPLLFIYRNDPCVVIGRNQNPWTEVNLAELAKRNIPLVRRRSGGGTVYHDAGNTCFSIHSSRTAFDRKASANIVVRAARALGIPSARITERNDIAVGEDKVSGSAYRITANRAYHHGTMLLKAQLGALADLLHVDKPTMISSGVASVRSPVGNLRDYNIRATYGNFALSLAEQFRRVHEFGESAFWQSKRETEYWDGKAVGQKKIPQATPGSKWESVYVEEQEMRAVEHVQRSIEEMQSWEWLYGQTPQFTYTLQETFSWGAVTCEISSRHGRILSCTLKPSPSTSQEVEPILRELEMSAEGQKYGEWPTPPTHTPVSWKVDPNRQLPPHHQAEVVVAPVRDELQQWLSGALR
ncbi:Lipoyltransferase/lipoate-protein ligase [Mycena kentingensis (nom. inval.)]|nr:Lipoyltransferase/lipoate-protein ligase [Mycena kentingensis (nom. inval.)]